MRKILYRLIYIIFVLLLILFLLQFVFSHIFNVQTIPYKKLDIRPILNQPLSMTNDDYNTLLLQTGLGQDICEELLKDKKNGTSKLLYYQDEFFKKKHIKCKPLCGWIVRTDILINESGNPILAPEILDAQPGDILLSFSTHSFGWRHGHAALVIEDNKTLESRVIGENSEISTVDHFRQYSNYILLRKKNISNEQLDTITNYANHYLNNVPYRLCGSIFYRTYQSCYEKGFGVNCSSLIWYAFKAAGIDLDSNGGLFVTPQNIYNSDHLEIIQIYGMNPLSKQKD